jgi:two-component system, OmpR family, phosphate regulon sensor histidine kinase PhoR
VQDLSISPLIPNPKFMMETTTPDLSLGDFRDEQIAHLMQELRTPITNIRTALKLLESSALKPAQRQKYLDLIRDECDRQNSLVCGSIRLLDLEHTAIQTDFEAIYLAEIIPGVVSTYQPLAEEKGIKLGYTVPDNLPAIHCIEIWLRQIAIDLLHNAIKYTPEGGEVFVCASMEGERIQLEFKDSGIGIPPAEIAKIFDRFYRIRNLPDASHNNSAGLGLTIVRDILLRCGGSISVTSEVGIGSSFKILLPTQ